MPSCSSPSCGSTAATCYKDNTKATWDSEAGVKALTWMVDLVKKGYSPKNVGQDADYIALKNSKNAMNWQGIWQVGDAR